MKLGDLLMVEVGKTKLIQTYLELKCLCALVPKFFNCSKEINLFL